MMPAAGLSGRTRDGRVDLEQPLSQRVGVDDCINNYEQDPLMTATTT